MPLYKTLARMFKDQPHGEIFAHLGWEGKAGETWETPYSRLAQIAKPEPWNFRDERFREEGQNYPILVKYLNYTFLRAQDQEKIVYSDDGQYCVFNTGLQTPEEKDIYAQFTRTRDAAQFERPDWTLYYFIDSYSPHLRKYPRLPEIPTYITDSSDLVYDVSYDIEINVTHILDYNRDRLPRYLQTNRTLALSALNGQKDLIREKVKRNYKYAIPHWYNNKIQLLLPLCLSDEGADLAFVADKDNDMRLYRIVTVLTLDMAYIDARLICRLEDNWLQV